MTAILLACGVLLPCVAAWALLRLADPSPQGVAGHALRAGLALLLGPAATTILVYAWLLGGAALGRGYALSEAVLCALVAAWALRRRRPADAAPAPGPTRVEWAALAVALVAILLATVFFVRGAAASPHGDWDAWAIWNQRARFLFRGGNGGWRFAFDAALAWSNTGYPLLLPAAVARLWAYAGETAAAPGVVAGVFALAPLLVLLGGAGRQAGIVAGAAATVLLAGTSSWFLWAYAQGADIPVGALVAAAVTALIEAEGAEGRRRAALDGVAGLALGLAAWTKDEGLMFAAVFGAAALVRAGRAGALRRAAALALGAALPLAARLHFQVTIAPALAAALTAGQSAVGIADRVLDGARWRQIIATVPGHLPGYGRGLPLVPFILAPLAGARPRALLRSYAVPALGAYAAFLLVYAATPLPLAYHITTSAPRILNQPWPALLLGLFAIARRRSAGAMLAASEQPDVEPRGERVQKGTRQRRRASRRD